MEINVWQPRDWRSRRQIHCGEGTQTTKDSGRGLSRRWKGSGQQGKHKPVLEVWCEGRGSPVWEVSPPEWGLCSSERWWLSIHSLPHILLPLGTRWGPRQGESEAASVKSHPLRDRRELCPSSGKCEASLSPVLLHCPATVSLLFRNLDPVAICFYSIFALNHGQNLSFYCGMPLFFLILGSCFGPWCPMTQRTIASEDVWPILPSLSSSFFPAWPLAGFMSKLWVMPSVAKYSFWSPPKISAPSPEQTQRSPSRPDSV